MQERAPEVCDHVLGSLPLASKTLWSNWYVLFNFTADCDLQGRRPLRIPRIDLSSMASHGRRA